MTINEISLDELCQNIQDLMTQKATLNIKDSKNSNKSENSNKSAQGKNSDKLETGPQEDSNTLNNDSIDYSLNNIIWADAIKSRNTDNIKSGNSGNSGNSNVEMVILQSALNPTVNDIHLEQDLICELEEDHVSQPDDYDLDHDDHLEEETESDEGYDDSEKSFVPSRHQYHNQGLSKFAKVWNYSSEIITSATWSFLCQSDTKSQQEEDDGKDVVLDEQQLIFKNIIQKQYYIV